MKAADCIFTLNKGSLKAVDCIFAINKGSLKASDCIFAINKGSLKASDSIFALNKGKIEVTKTNLNSAKSKFLFEEDKKLEYSIKSRLNNNGDGRDW